MRCEASRTGGKRGHITVGTSERSPDLRLRDTRVLTKFGTACLLAARGAFFSRSAALNLHTTAASGQPASPAHAAPGAFQA